MPDIKGLTISLSNLSLSSTQVNFFLIATIDWNLESGEQLLYFGTTSKSLMIQSMALIRSRSDISNLLFTKKKPPKLISEG